MNSWRGTGRSRRILAAVLLCAFSGAGCYRYADARGTTRLDNAAPVRIRLASPAPVHLSMLTVNGAVDVEGEFVRQTADSVIVSAMHIVDAAGRDYDGNGETVMIGRDRIETFEAKRISPLRTALMGAGVIAAGALTATALTDAAGGAGTSGSGGTHTK
jgi:hypothetical protein